MSFLDEIGTKLLQLEKKSKVAAKEPEFTLIEAKIVKFCTEPRVSSSIIELFPARPHNVLGIVQSLVKRGILLSCTNKYVANLEHRDFNVVMTMTANKKAAINAGETDIPVGTKVRVVSVSDPSGEDIVGLTGQITHPFPGLMAPDEKYIAGIWLDNGEKTNLLEGDKVEVVEKVSEKKAADDYREDLRMKFNPYYDAQNYIVYKLPFKGNTIEDVLSIKDKDVQELIHNTLHAFDYVETSDGNVFSVGEIWEHTEEPERSRFRWEPSELYQKKAGTSSNISDTWNNADDLQREDLLKAVNITSDYIRQYSAIDSFDLLPIWLQNALSYEKKASVLPVDETLWKNEIKDTVANLKADNITFKDAQEMTDYLVGDKGDLTVEQKEYAGQLYNESANTVARKKAEETKHELVIKSLSDAMAECSAGDWYFSRTGPATREEIKEEFEKAHKYNKKAEGIGKIYSIFEVVDEIRESGYGAALIDAETEKIITPYVDPSDYPDLEFPASGYYGGTDITGKYRIEIHSGQLEEEYYAQKGIDPLYSLGLVDEKYPSKKGEKKVANYSSYKDEDGDTVFKIPFDAENIEQLVNIPDEELQEFLYSDLASYHGIKTKDSNIFWGSDIQDALRNLHKKANEKRLRTIGEVVDEIRESGYGAALIDLEATNKEPNLYEEGIILTPYVDPDDYPDLKFPESDYYGGDDTTGKYRIVIHSGQLEEEFYKQQKSKSGGNKTADEIESDINVTKTKEGYLYEYRTPNDIVLKQHYIGYDDKEEMMSNFLAYIKDKEMNSGEIWEQTEKKADEEEKYRLSGNFLIVQINGVSYKAWYPNWLTVAASTLEDIKKRNKSLIIVEDEDSGSSEIFEVDDRNLMDIWLNNKTNKKVRETLVEKVKEYHSKKHSNKEYDFMNDTKQANENIDESEKADEKKMYAEILIKPHYAGFNMYDVEANAPDYEWEDYTDIITLWEENGYDVYNLTDDGVPEEMEDIIEDITGRIYNEPETVYALVQGGEVTYSGIDSIDIDDKEASKKQASAYTDFVGKYMKENEGSSIGDAAKAWSKQKGKSEDKTDDKSKDISKDKKDTKVKDKKDVAKEDKKDKEKVEKKADNEDFDEEFNEPSPQDYVMHASRKGMSVGQVEGKFLGEFDDEDSAMIAIKEDMELNKFWPNVWYQDDHGGLSLRTASKKQANFPIEGYENYNGFYIDTDTYKVYDIDGTSPYFADSIKDAKNWIDKEMVKMAVSEESSLSNLSSGTVTLTFNTEKLLKDFDLPSLSSTDEFTMDYWPSDKELTETMYLDVSYNDDDELVDADRNLLTEEVIDDIKRAIVDAMEIGTRDKAIKRIQESLEEVLNTFSDSSYEYWFDGKSGEEIASGTATGITSVDVNYDITTITADYDLVHLINDMIVGVGMFSVDGNLEGESIEEYIKSRFHHLTNYWEVYGKHKPKVDFNNTEDFNKEYFINDLNEIKKQYSINIVDRTASKKVSVRIASPEVSVGDVVKIDMNIVKKHDNIPPYIRLVNQAIKNAENGMPYVSEVDDYFVYIRAWKFDLLGDIRVPKSAIVYSKKASVKKADTVYSFSVVNTEGFEDSVINTLSPFGQVNYEEEGVEEGGSVLEIGVLGVPANKLIAFAKTVESLGASIWSVAKGNWGVFAENHDDLTPTEFVTQILNAKEASKKNADESFKTVKDYEKWIKENSTLLDIVTIGDTVFTMDNYDEEGKEVSYGNKTNEKSFIVSTKNRYKSFSDVKVSEIEDMASYRTDITYEASIKKADDEKTITEVVNVPRKVSPLEKTKDIPREEYIVAKEANDTLKDLYKSVMELSSQIATDEEEIKRVAAEMKKTKEIDPSKALLQESIEKLTLMLSESDKIVTINAEKVLKLVEKSSEEPVLSETVLAKLEEMREKHRQIEEDYIKSAGAQMKEIKRTITQELKVIPLRANKTAISFKDIFNKIKNFFTGWMSDAKDFGKELDAITW